VILRPAVDHAALDDALLDALRPVAGRVSLHLGFPGAAERAAALGMGLHLPGSAQIARWRRGFGGLLSWSAHTPVSATAGLAAGLDEVLLAPIFAARSKPGDARASLGLAALRAAPGTIALGGITPGNARACIDAGAAGVAVLSGLFGAGVDPREGARRLRQSLDGAAGS
jgi:thiamine-phosphate pyrophosphorylase